MAALSGPDSLLVFKGGTSLSKALHFTHRFSADVDILLVPPAGYGEARTDRLLKQLVQQVTVHLGIEPSKSESTRGMKRTAWYPYPARHASAGVRSEVLLEMGRRDGVLPGTANAGVSFYVTEYLIASGQSGQFVEESVVEVAVLSPVRTLLVNG